MSSMVSTVTLLSENWIEKVKCSNNSQPIITTLKFGENQNSYVDVSQIAIQFSKPYQLFKSKTSGQEYGYISFGIYQFHDLEYNAHFEFVDDFNMMVKKDVIDFFKNNCTKCKDSDFHQAIQEKFGLNVGISMSENMVYFDFIDNEKNYIIDFAGLANMVFKQIGLVG